MKFSGVITALVSPFLNNKFDSDSFEKLLQFQVDNGVNDFVINGTTGESPCLDWSEVELMFEITRKTLPSAKIILGTGTNNTKSSIENTNRAKELGADAAMLMTPYYNKPSQSGIKSHFLNVAEACDIDLILYNVPGRTIVGIETDTVISLAQHPRIIGIKDATGDMNYHHKITSELEDQFVYLSGDDFTFTEYVLKGGNGVVSVLSNVAPRHTVDLFQKAHNQDPSALVEFENLKKICDILFAEPSPAPAKASLLLQGIIASSELRLPLVEASQELRDDLKFELQKLGLLR